MTSTNGRIEIVEVGPRDGFQAIVPFIPTDEKIAFVRDLLGTGIRRIEIGSFVSAKSVPQMRDTREVLNAFAEILNADFQVLVPNLRGGRDALHSQARHIVFVMSASAGHNRANVGKDPTESSREFSQLTEELPPAARLRLNIATVFDCPFAGKMPASATLNLLKGIEPQLAGVEVCLCDTTGGADPSQVEDMFGCCRESFKDVNWAFHAHDTYGTGLANVHSAYRSGVRIFDASIGGLGGCPFAPGATGNVATEDMIWMFERMGVRTGVDFERLLVLAQRAAALDGACAGGRVRGAMLARKRNGLLAGAQAGLAAASGR